MNRLKANLFTTVAAGIMLSATAAKADFVVADDLIVQGSTCTGFDCVNGETFGSDTLKLKENNLRVLFQDTSTSASFPTTDWRLIANDSSNGGANHFSIENPSKMFDDQNNHYQNWLSAIKSRGETICPAETGHRSATVCNVANIAYWLGQPLEWNPVKEQFKDNEEANALLKRQNRNYS